MQHHYAEAVPSHGAVFSEHCHFHVSHDERSHIVRALPGHWHKRQGSNLHIWESKSHALPFGYACVCLPWDTSLRGAGSPVMWHGLGMVRIVERSAKVCIIRGRAELHLRMVFTVRRLHLAPHPMPDGTKERCHSGTG